MRDETNWQTLEQMKQKPARQDGIPVEFTETDIAAADAYADSKAKAYSNGWHKARDGYLTGRAHERRARTNQFTLPSGEPVKPTELEPT